MLLEKEAMGFKTWGQRNNNNNSNNDNRIILLLPIMIGVIIKKD